MKIKKYRFLIVVDPREIIAIFHSKVLCPSPLSETF